MAPGKKQKKSKKKGSKDRPSSLSHIASRLIPSAIFAAVPRTPTNFNQTWPRRSPSPIAQAIGEAGNIGRSLLGDLSKRPASEVPQNPEENPEGSRNDNITEEVAEFEEPGYESVQNGKNFDRTTKYSGMSRAEREELTGAEAASPEQHFYHILDHQNGQVIEPVIYSRVDKKKKIGSKQQDHEEKDENDSGSDYSSDDLTDVTSHYEESTTTSGPRRRQSKKGSKKERQENRDSVDGPAAKKSSVKIQTPITIQEVVEEGEREDSDVPPIPPYLGNSTPEAPRRSNRKKGQMSEQDEMDGPGQPLPPVPGVTPEDSWLTDEQRRALKVVERLGFEGVSQKVALSDLSSESDTYMSPVVPKNTIDFNGRTTFEREQFNDTSTDSPFLVTEAKIEETTLNSSNTFADVDNLELQGAIPSPTQEVQSGEAGDHVGFKTKVAKANKVSSFVQLLNEQERQRQDELATLIPEKGRRVVAKNSSDFDGRRSFEQELEDGLLMDEPDLAKDNKVSSFVQLLNEREMQRQDELVTYIPEKGRRETRSFEQEQEDGLSRDEPKSAKVGIYESSPNLGSSFAIDDDLNLQKGFQAPNGEARSGQTSGHKGFKKQAKKANKVSSFVHSLNEQEKHRQSSSMRSTEDTSPFQPERKGNDIDPVLLKRLEEVKQANETSFAERQRQLEALVEQQKALYHEQLEHQKIQQQQQQEVVRQQWKLQEQLRALEKMQQEFNENADHSPRGPKIGEADMRLQRELIRQQQEFLQQQQEQLSKSQNQQAQALKQQEQLCNQIRQLEEQQKQLQSSVSLLSPAGDDLAEIKQQERQIVDLLNEQRRQESELQRLHLLQQQRLEEQSNSFTHERKALEQNQEMLKLKINEQEARSRQLERELEEMARKHADAEIEWRRKMSAFKDETAGAAKSEILDRRDAKYEHRGEDQGRVTKKNSDREKLGERSKKRALSVDYSVDYSDVVESPYKPRSRKPESYHDETEGHIRRTRRRSSNADAEMEERLMNTRGTSDVHYDKGKARSSRTRGRRSNEKDNVEDSLEVSREEGSQRERRRGQQSRQFDAEENLKAESSQGRSARNKSERKTRRTRETSIETENVITKTNAEVTQAAQVMRDDEMYQLSRGRIELLESEKAAYMELNASLQEENKALKQLALSLQKGTGVSSVVLQTQIKDLHREQAVLRDTVHRLNVELSRYQAKYRPVSYEEVEGMALPYKKEAAPWLVNTKFLAPLFLAYDDRLKEKDQLIRTYDEELNAFKARVIEVVKENQQLHMSVSKTSPDALRPDEWQQLQEQAKLVLEENALLMEQQEIQERKIKEMQRIHGQEVSKLSKRISSQESTLRRLETELDDSRLSQSTVLRKNEALVADQENKMLISEHLRVMDECRSVLEDLKAKTKLESEDYSSRLQAIQKEKSDVAIKLADTEARNAQLKRELDAYQKSLKKSERKFLLLQRKLEHIQERELAAQETLAQVLTVAEKTAAERDDYVQFAKTQKVQQEKDASKILAGTQNIKGLQEKLQEYRRKSTDKVAVVTGRLREKEKEINKLKEQYEAEINNLRGQVRQKQRQLEIIIGENRNVDRELEQVWRNAAADNRRMKNTVREKGGMFDSDSDPNIHLSSEEGEAA